MKCRLAATALALVATPLAYGTPSYVGQFVSSNGAAVTPLYQAGAPADSPAARVDPQAPNSAFSGVVSINIRYDGNSFICSGTAIDPTHVLTAAHCVDTNGHGKVIDLTKPGSDVRVVVNDGPFNAATDLITANRVAIHPNYNGFNICPDNSPGCVNDDLAVITLPTPLPASVNTYAMADQSVLAVGSQMTLVGFGTSGTGITGYTVAPSFFVRRVGGNIYDLFDNDDEANFDPSSPREVWYYDFDGRNAAGVLQDTFCTLGLACSAQLPNNVETLAGGGDSGGPAFIQDALGNWLLAATSTFGLGFMPVAGTFGDAGGGILLYSYVDWIRTQVVPEPGTLPLIAVAVIALAGLSRRRGLLR